MLATVAASVASAEEPFELGVADECRQAMARTEPVLHMKASVPKLQIPDAKQVPQIHDHQWLTPVAQHKPPAEHRLPLSRIKQAPGACQVLQRHPPPQMQQQPVQAAPSIASDTDAREHEQKHKDRIHVSAFIQKNCGDEEALASDSVLMSYSDSDSTATGDSDSRIGVIPQRYPKRRFVRPECVPRLSMPPPQSQPLPRCNQAPQEQQQQTKARTQSATRSKECRQPEPPQRSYSMGACRNISGICAPPRPPRLWSLRQQSKASSSRPPTLRSREGTAKLTPVAGESLVRLHIKPSDQKGTNH